MDTSKEYIKMCDCEEIQNLWKPSVGDFQCSDEGLNLYIQQYADWYKVNENLEGWKEGAIWLPRQDQLQEMLDNENYKNHVHYRFSEFLESKYSISAQCAFIILMNMFENCSMEQLWLAFVMKEKHNKIWNGERWVTYE